MDLKPNMLHVVGMNPLRIKVVSLTSKRRDAAVREADS